ncbi:MAG TPA: hypothetical protein VJ819_02420 [Nocardioidaceae bacterium]|nr:hypothetical protein [Nocardioidaceae bacterium]
MRRALAGTAVAILVLTGCGSTGAGSEATDSSELEESAASTPSATEEPSTEPSPQPSAEPSDDDGIEVEIEGGEISPNGKRVKVDVGEPVTLEVESDRPGEFHVHSTPEQTIAFGKGETTVEITIDTPGVVDVEEHEAGIVVLQLEVG